MTTANAQLYIGLMSGTSADGVDAALVEFNDQKITLRGFVSPSLPEKLKQQLIQLNESPTLHLEAFSQLSFDIAQQFIQASKQLLKSQNIDPSDVAVIGSHGQTIYHAPEIPMTLQIGHPALIAKATNIRTAGDFRVDDMALGGQGAPFAPAFHQVLFQSKTPCFVVNIGGIANISYLPSSLDKETRPLGYDTGPGNALMDEICQGCFDKPFDENGEIAAQGRIHPTLLNKLLAHPYFQQPLPKSTGRDTFNLAWLKNIEQSHANETGETISDTDLLATLCELTAITIANEINKMIEAQNVTGPTKTPVWIVGGGAFNKQLIQRIQHHLESCVVQSSQTIDIDPNAIEAMMCAWLAKQRIENRTVALSEVTGAQRDAVLGGLWHP